VLILSSASSNCNASVGMWSCRSVLGQWVGPTLLGHRAVDSQHEIVAEESSHPCTESHRPK
jgi:hypothetical protein